MWLTVGGAVFVAGGLCLFAVTRFRMVRWQHAPQSGVMIDSFLGRGDPAMILCLVIGGWVLAAQTGLG